MEDEPLYQWLTSLLHQFSPGLQDKLVSQYSGWTVVSTTVAGEAVERGLRQFTELQFFVENAAQESQPPSGRCPLDAGGFVDRTRCQAETALVATT